MRLENRASTNEDLKGLFLLRSGVVFLNHGSFGACPRPVFESYQRWQRELESQPVEFMQRRLKDLLAQTRTDLGAFLGADPDDLVLVTNASMGLNIVARSMKLSAGDEILSTDQEYGTLDRTWDLVCEKSGAKHIRMPVSLPILGRDDVVDAVWSGVSPRTKVLFVSHITSPTGMELPVAELIARARARGIITIVDGAHVPGQLAVDLNALGADFYSGNCHKWLMSPKGAGFLHARREVQDLLEPLVGGRASRRAIEAHRSRFLIEHQYQGTRDQAAFLSVPDAIRFMETHDWDSVRSRCHELVRYARRRMTEVTGIPGVIPDSPKWFAQMSVLPLPKCDTATLRQRLLDDHDVEIPITASSGMHFARISVQGYNTQSDVDALIDGVAAILPDVTETTRKQRVSRSRNLG